MKMLVCRKFTFEAAHWLPKHPKCGEMHGHTYTVEMKFEVNPEKDLEMDFDKIKEIEEYVKMAWDHQMLNNFFDMPTVECLGKTLFKSIQEMEMEMHFKPLKEIRIWEGLNNWVEVMV